MEGNVIERESPYGALWEVVVNLECLVQGLQEWMIRLEHDIGTRHLKICIGLALEKLLEYVGKTSQSPVWLAALGTTS